MLRPIPSVALIPLALLIFGFGCRMEIAVVAFACFWPLLIMTESAVRGIEPRLIEVARMLGLSASRRACSRSCCRPRCRASSSACASAAAVALVVAVTAEIAANPIGLGYALMIAQESCEPDACSLCLIWIGLLGWLVNAALLRARSAGSAAWATGGAAR